MAQKEDDWEETEPFAFDWTYHNTIDWTTEYTSRLGGGHWRSVHQDERRIPQSGHLFGCS
jgi:hypothetical protein